MAVGAFLLPPLADRIGRKPVLAMCLTIVGLLTFWAAFSASFAMLAWLRGISGIFFSAMLPIGLALLSESTPRRRRALFMSIALVCFSGGNLGSGWMVTALLDDNGWELFFLAGGIVPLLAVPLLLLIPESLAFRVTRNPADPRIAEAIHRLDPSIPLHGGEVFHLGDATPLARMGPWPCSGRSIARRRFCCSASASSRWGPSPCSPTGCPPTCRNWPTCRLPPSLST